MARLPPDIEYFLRSNAILGYAHVCVREVFELPPEPIEVPCERIDDEPEKLESED
jgi:hypothetical protein